MQCNCIRLTHDVEEGILDQRRVGGHLKHGHDDNQEDDIQIMYESHLALVQTNICLLGELYLQFPIVRFLKDDLESCVAAVSLAAVGEKVRILVLANPLQPGNLRQTRHYVKSYF